MLPVPEGTPVTQKYGNKSPRYKNAHGGIDFGIPKGRRVVACVSGTVVHAGTHKFRSGWGPAFGIQVIVSCDRFADGPAGLWIGYMHLSEARVVKGSRVNAGQIIGLSGNTGASTAPHLHVEVQQGRQWRGFKFSVNPAKWLAA